MVFVPTCPRWHIFLPLKASQDVNIMLYDFLATHLIRKFLSLYALLIIVHISVSVNSFLLTKMLLVTLKISKGSCPCAHAYGKCCRQCTMLIPLCGFVDQGKITIVISVVFFFFKPETSEKSALFSVYFLFWFFFLKLYSYMYYHFSSIKCNIENVIFGKLNIKHSPFKK